MLSFGFIGESRHAILWLIRGAGQDAFVAGTPWVIEQPNARHGEWAELWEDEER
jgi:hypothetical protein